jgi:hypothetical protein
MGPEKFEDAAREFGVTVQIVSRPPDFLRPKFRYLNQPRTLMPFRQIGEAWSSSDLKPTEDDKNHGNGSD